MPDFMILINFKSYLNSFAANASRIGKAAEKVHEETGVNVVCAPQHCDIRLLHENISSPIFAQHMDAIIPGKNTGFILPQALKAAGASGTLLNHAEHRIHHEDIKRCVEICKKLKMTSVVCAEDLIITEKLERFLPSYIAIEVPELIGSGRSISTIKPELVRSAVEEVYGHWGIPVLCGAGISTAQDVKAAFDLGTAGILVASSVVKAKDPYEVLRDFATSI